MSRWLQWKIGRGLTYRGRITKDLSPRGVIAKVLYLLYYKRVHNKQVARANETSTKPPTVYHQRAGGTVGPRGQTNGE